MTVFTQVLSTLGQARVMCYNLSLTSRITNNWSWSAKPNYLISSSSWPQTKSFPSKSKLKPKKYKTNKIKLLFSPWTWFFISQSLLHWLHFTININIKTPSSSHKSNLLPLLLHLVLISTPCNPLLTRYVVSSPNVFK